MSACKPTRTRRHQKQNAPADVAASREQAARGTQPTTESVAATNHAGNTKLVDASSMSLVARDFCGRTVPMVKFGDQLLFPAVAVARALDRDDAWRFLRNVVDKGDAEEGVDYIRVRTSDLPQEIRDGIGPANSAGPIKPQKKGGAHSLTMLTESGLYMALQASRHPLSVVFRRWIARDVAPSIAKTGSYSVRAARRVDAAASVSSQAIEAPQPQAVIISSHATGLLGPQSRHVVDIPLNRLARRMESKFGGKVLGHKRGLENKLRKALGFWASFSFYPVEALRMSMLLVTLRDLDIYVSDRTRGLPDKEQVETLFSSKSDKKGGAR